MAVAERELNVHVGVTLDQWIADNDGLIKKVASLYYWKFRNLIAPVDFDDLFQIAAMSVVESYNRFVKVNDNVDFIKYAVHYMHFKIERFINFKARSIHVPLGQRNKVSNKVLSLNFKAHNQESNTSDDAEDEFAERVLGIEGFASDDIYTQMFIENLTPRKRKVLEMRMQELHYSEIGEAMGFSGESARMIVKSIRKDWRAWNGEEVEEGEPEIGSPEELKKWAIVAVERGINPKTYYSRVKKGIRPQDAAMTPVTRRRGKHGIQSTQETDSDQKYDQ